MNVDYATHHAEITAAAAGAAVAIPVAIFILCLWFLHDRPSYRQSRWFGPAAAVAILATRLSGNAVLLTGLILASVIAIKLFMRRQALTSAMTRIALGCMRLSTEGDRDDARSLAVIHAALDAGIALLDTADAYRLAAVTDTTNAYRESTRVLSGDRLRFRVATKGGLVRPRGEWIRDGRATLGCVRAAVVPSVSSASTSTSCTRPIRARRSRPACGRWPNSSAMA